MLTKIICVGLATVLISTILKEYRQDFAMLANICGGLVISLMAVSELSSVMQEMSLLGLSVSADAVVIPIVKVIGIGYITELCADLAEDSGNKTISSKILLGGKIAICAVALPIIKNMLSVILSLLSL